MAHVTQSRPDSGRGFQVKISKLLIVSCSRGSGRAGVWVHLGPFVHKWGGVAPGNFRSQVISSEGNRGVADGLSRGCVLGSRAGFGFGRRDWALGLGLGLGVGRRNGRRNVKRFRGGLVFKAYRLLYHSTLGSRVIKKKKSLGAPGKFRS